jgi:superfamily II DNA or RNA helicase
MSFENEIRAPGARPGSEAVSPKALLASSFEPAVRQRGRKYYRSGAVVMITGGPLRVAGAIRGKRLYEAGISLEGEAHEWDCSCPYFRDRGPCKHLYALLLAAESQGYLSGASHAAADAQPEDADEFEGDDLTDDEDPDDWILERGAGEEFIPHRRPRVRGGIAGKTGRRKPGWGELLDAMDQPLAGKTAARAAPRERRIEYVLDREGTLQGRGLALELACSERRADGEWGKRKSFRIRERSHVRSLPEESDRRILAMMIGASDYGYDFVDMSVVSYLSGELCDVLLPEMSATGRLYVRADWDEDPAGPLMFDPGPPWRLVLRLRRSEDGDFYRVDALLRREDGDMKLADPVLLLAGEPRADGGFDPGWVFTASTFARLEDRGAFRWIAHLRRETLPPLPAAEAQSFLQKLLASRCVPELDLPEELRFEEVSGRPRPRLRVGKPERGYRPGLRSGNMPAEVSFSYDGQVVPAGGIGGGIYDPQTRRLLRREAQAEAAARRRLRELGFREPGRSRWEAPDFDLQISPRRLPKAVKELTREGWHIEAEGRIYRQASGFKLSVNAGIDWFELSGGIDFGGGAATLPALLSALRKGEASVVLDDGSVGMLPEEWLARWAPLMQLGKAGSDHLRFAPCQAALLDVLLAAQPGADCDRVFAEAREKLRAFESVRPAKEPPGFRGRLRAYQREGLGWLNFLDEFGFGGCLADDMGLGKTVQVLALLQAQAKSRGAGEKRPRPSLVVVPRSLLHNWAAEAEHFTPGLRVLRHAGGDRRREPPVFADFDLVLTTYGTMRRDATFLKDVEFNYAVLDEAQAIKNPTTAAAKASRLLNARRRLALTGTPVENHLNDLWSIMEFLNPGMLGSAGVFRKWTLKREGLSEEHLESLGRALRPFILRRTKSQVAADLPEKIEQTVYCELQGRQLRDYRQLRDHYRQALLTGKDLKRMKIQVLEALLRLRQAACHPGLIDRGRKDEDSAKLEALLPQLQEVVEEGSKALVFSQFTSFLSIVRRRLDDLGLKYAYLDGRTRKRAEKVKLFQDSPDCPLFLISLKAGGLGLNLTAAEYVFLLDPWWNPAVEAQAVDRTHRIGQTRKVFAYRLICRETVEERVLELQGRKRRMAEAIVSADRSLLTGLTREDLELLLS